MKWEAATTSRHSLNLSLLGTYLVGDCEKQQNHNICNPKGQFNQQWMHVWPATYKHHRWEKANYTLRILITAYITGHIPIVNKIKLECNVQAIVVSNVCFFAREIDNAGYPGAPISDTLHAQSAIIISTLGDVSGLFLVSLKPSSRGFNSTTFCHVCKVKREEATNEWLLPNTPISLHSL